MPKLPQPSLRNAGHLFVLLVGLLVCSTPAWADDWHDAANYPARVVSFNFGSDVLDQTHPMRFGSWTVSFGAYGLPTMINKIQYFTTTFPPFTLMCTNAVRGQEPCAMMLTPASSGTSEKCTLDGNDDMIPMPCPTSITFEH